MTNELLNDLIQTEGILQEVEAKMYDIGQDIRQMGIDTTEHYTKAHLLLTQSLLQLKVVLSEVQYVARG
jgi:hypothetical protein